MNLTIHLQFGLRVSILKNKVISPELVNVAGGNLPLVWIVSVDHSLRFWDGFIFGILSFVVN